MKFNFFNILMLLGSVQGFILCMLLTFHPQYRKRSNLFLTLLVFTISLQNVSNSLIDVGIEWVEFLPLSWTLLIPFSLHYFVVYLIDPAYRFKPMDYLLLAPFALQLCFKLIAFVLFLLHGELPKLHAASFYSSTYALEVLAILWCLYVIASSSRKIRINESILRENFSELKGKTLLWLDYTLKAAGLLWILWTTSFIYSITVEPLNNLSYFNWIGMAAIIYWIGYSVIAKRTVFEIPATIEDKSDNPKMLSDKAEEYYKKIRSLMEEEKLFLTPELSMHMLSQRVGISSGYISSILNQIEGRNFFDFINSYRVEEVKRRMSEPKFSHFSLLGIAYDSGFTSKSTFNAVFKKATGMTPSAYKASIK